MTSWGFYFCFGDTLQRIVLIICISIMPVVRNFQGKCRIVAPSPKVSVVTPHFGATIPGKASIWMLVIDICSPVLIMNYGWDSILNIHSIINNVNFDWSHTRGPNQEPTTLHENDKVMKGALTHKALKNVVTISCIGHEFCSTICKCNLETNKEIKDVCALLKYIYTPPSFHSF